MTKKEAKNRKTVGFICLILCGLNVLGIACGIVLLFIAPDKAPGFGQMIEMVIMFVILRFAGIRFVNDYYESIGEIVASKD